MRRHLGHVLVGQRQAVEEMRRGDRIRMIRVFHLGNHLLAAAGIAGHGIDGDGIADREDAGGAQRPDEADRTRRIAAGIGNEACRLDLVALVAIHLRKTIGPVRMDAEGGGGVDDADIVVARHHLHRFLRRVVGQAENGDIGAVQHVLAHGGIAPLGFRNGQQLDIAAVGHARADLQARGSVFAIDEDLRCHLIPALSIG